MKMDATGNGAGRIAAQAVLRQTSRFQELID
jgi:hypothetical protein